MTSGAPAGGTFTGRHMAIILVSFFAVVIGVNVTMAVMAGSTFGGTVVDNSYVASQRFNGWLAEGRAQAALGWDMRAARLGDGRVRLLLVAEGGTLTGAVLTGRAVHPLGRMADRAMAFREDAPGSYVSIAPLPAGRWRLRVTATLGSARADRILPLS